MAGEGVKNAQSNSKSTLDKISGILDDASKIVKTRKTTTGALIAAVLGGVIKLTVVTQTFPAPFDVVGNVIIFAAVLMVVIDLCRGGLED
jgi:hypothetical protein